ncbi:ArnT family glycosyltransferase [Rubinisphaera margarita]|uniref:ArnT family glycosyltransferase n=1 Tax=Rubinisphaera margarita TaxID=2909586 RepID=UPI001EE969FB|nr:glycosyltransferase family 39 protein [Rubinisphaera margarita]MCG6156278.1 glycosyltransferase family 39 protein [Rubinisphaera margarita]
MTNVFRHQLILLLTCGCVFFFNLGGARLFDEDEPKNAECGREMHERGDWIVPTYNYELRTDKPIMLYWLMLTSFEVFDVSEFSARLPSAIMATGTVLLVYHIGRMMFGHAVGLWGGLILASGLMFVTSSRISTPDATLISFITLSIFLFVRSQVRTEKGWATPDETQGPRAFMPQRYWGFLALYAVMGLAVLTKGPVGFLLPCAVIGLYLMCRAGAPYLPVGLDWRKPFDLADELLHYLVSFFAPSRFFPALWAMRPLTLVAVLALVALPWYITVGIVTDGAWLEGFLGGHNVGRFSSAMEGHSGPIFYYVVAIMAGFFPWSVFLPITLYLAVMKRWKWPQDHQGLLFLLCWAGVYVVFFSIAQTKLPNYVLPAYPPLALLTAWMLVRWQEGEIELPEWAYVWGARSLMIAGAVLIVAFPIVAWLLLPGYWAVGLVGVLPILAGLWMIRHDPSDDRTPVLNGLGICAVGLVLAAFSGAAPWISQAQDSSLLGLAVNEKTDRAVPMATYRYFAPNLPFYAQRPVLRYHSVEEIQSFWETNPEGVLCIQKADLAELHDVLPKSTVVLDEADRFLRPGSVLLLAKNGDRFRTAAAPVRSLESVIR